MTQIVADWSLARLLEGAEARTAAECAHIYRRLHPESEASVLEIAGGVAAFAGVGSPLTQAVGLGMNGPVTPADFETVETFFRMRGSGVNMHLCPLADPSFVEQFGRRGYRIAEFNNILVRRIEAPIAMPEEAASTVAPHEHELWSRVLAQGFFEHENPTPEELEIGTVLAQVPGVLPWIASNGEIDTGAAALLVRDRLASFFADSTLPQFRKRGVQKSLIETRLAWASSEGATFATAATLPGTVSQRNYERAGFQVIYTKMIMVRE